MRLIEKLWDYGLSIPKSPVIVADNCCDYLFSLEDNKLRYVTDLPCVKPPFDEMWIEARRPTVTIPTGSQKQLRMFGHRIYRPEPESDPRWWLFIGYVETALGQGRAEYLDVAVEIGEQGQPLSTKYRAGISDKTQIAAWLLYCSCLAISFMHCRNVISREIQTGATERTRKGKRRLVSYSVLEIDPMKDVLRQEGRAESTGLTRALHICRGHFRRYDRPLFGKTFTGTVWVPTHVRGSIDAGEVIKSYNVKAPPVPKGCA